MTNLTSLHAGKARIMGLDTIRGFAILLVLLRHAWPEVFGSAGIVGVVVFFALSGFLITGILERDIRDFGKVRFRRFYTHRFFRLMPPLIFVLAGFSAVEGIWNLLGDRQAIGQSIVVGLTYTMNVPGINHGSAALSHLWTLATEEQFYLLWPILLAFGIRRGRAVILTWICVLMALVACGVSVLLAFPETFRIYSLPTSWVAAMLLGAVAKLMEAELNRLMSPQMTKVLAMTATGILVALNFLPEAKNWPGTYLAVGPLIALCTVVIIFECKTWNTLPIPALIPLHWLGTVSYAAYLWNFPIANWLGDRPLNLAQGIASIVLTLLAAAASWYLIELPASKLRRRVDAKTERSKKILAPSHVSADSQH